MDTTAVTTAVCQLLHDFGVGVWSPTQAYLTTDVGVFYGPLGTLPDRAIGLTVYAATDDVETGLAHRYLQVRCRGAVGAPNGADALADSAFAALHGLYQTSGIARITRTSTAYLGADTNGRTERTDNYMLIIDNPEA